MAAAPRPPPATCARTQRPGKLADDLQTLNNQRGLSPRHSSPTMPPPLETLGVLSRFLRFPSLPHRSRFLWHQNSSPLWERSSSLLLFLEGAGAAPSSLSARGRKRRSPRAEGRDPLSARRGAGWQDVCSLCSRAARQAAGCASVSSPEALRSALCSLTVPVPPQPGAAPCPAGPFLPKASPWRGGRGFQGADPAPGHHSNEGSKAAAPSFPQGWPCLAFAFQSLSPPSFFFYFPSPASLR